MAAASMLVHVTHIDDSIQGLKGPCVHFWGLTNDRSLYLTMELFLESIRQSLETKLPPLNLSVLENMQICCVLINHRWQRAKIPELKLSHAGTIEVFCIDSGETHSVPLALVRTIDFSGYEANNIKECPALASKFILADVVAPCGPASHTRQWSKLAIMFLKIHMENHTWKAVPMGKHGTYQAVRLFDSNDQLFASIMIQQALGVAAQTYHEALSMCEVMNKQPAYMKPAFYSSPTMKLFPAGCNITALSNPVRPAFAIPISQQEQLLAPPVAYVINNLPVKGRHDVIVSHISDGPLKFFVQMKSEASILLDIHEKLNTTTPQPFHGSPMGSPCMALSPTDKLFRRGLIMGVKDYGNPGCMCTVYFVDIGTQYSINLSVLYIIPDELLVPSLCAYPVSLFGLQEVSNLCGLKEIFAAFVNSASSLQVEVVNGAKQEVNLYDETGRSIRDVLVSIFSNLKSTSNTPSAISSSLTNSVMLITVADMPSLNLAAEESLFVNFTEKPGFFFGQLEKIRLPNSKTVFGIKCLNDMADELSKAYASGPSPPLLYVDAESRLGHHGVVIWDVDQAYYRIRVTKELLSEAEVEFIDYGNSIWLSRDKILAPLGNLASLRQPPFGIHCQLNGDVNLSISKWKHLILDKWIKVKMGSCIESVYTVTFTSDPCNSEIVKILATSVSLKIEEEVGKTNQTMEICRPVSVQLVAPQASIVITDNRCIKTSDSGGYSITFANKQTVMETNDGNSRTRRNCSVTPGKGSNTELANGVDNYEDPGLSECKASAIVRPVEEVIQSERMELSCTSQTTSISVLQSSSSSGNETAKIPKELNGKLSIETVELREPAMVPVTSKLEAPIIQKQYAYPQQPVLTGLQKQIEVVFINDPLDFYVHLSESFASLEDLAKKLNLVYSDESKPAIQNAKPGSACVVQFEEDKLWYRGQIIKLYDSNLLVPLANVFFVDYGNSQRCPIKQIKAIDEEFVGLNPLAFQCRLDGIDVSHVWTAEERIQFEQCCIGKILTAAFTKQDAEAKYPLCLVEKSEGGTVVINEMFRKPIPASIEPMVYTKLPISETPIDVTITCCTDLGDFYLRPFDLTSYQNQLDELEKFYSALLPNELLEDQPSTGLPCVVRFSEDERFYRSEIISIHDEMVEVLFVDNGIKQDTPVSQLKRIIPRFMALPRLTWYCQLKEVKLNSPVSEELQKHLRSSILSRDKISALFHPASSEGTSEILEVELTLPTIGNLSQYLVQHEVLERTSSITEVEMVAQNVSFTAGQVISTRAITSFAKSPTEFWVQLEPEFVEAIMTRIDKLAVDPEFLNKKNFTASVGKHCLAFFADDGRWYRAVIEALSEDSAVVCYVDYGNSCIVNTCNLRGLPADLAETPVLAYKCCQEGTECFLMNVADMYVSVIVDEPVLTVKFVKAVDGVLYVRIFHPNGTDLGNLCSELPADLPEVPVEISTENVAPEVSNFIGEAKPEVSINTISSEVLGHTEESSEEPLIQEPVKTIEHVEGYVVFCISPVQFWFQTKEDEVKLNKIQAYLSEHYGENPDAFQIKDNPVVGQIYGINHPIYDGWYRGRIEKASDGAFEVNFVDYGDTQTVSLESIRDLLQEWADIPSLAIRCSWKQSTVWSQTAPEKFNAACFDSEKLCRVRFVAEENGVRFVDSLFVAECNVIDFLEA